MTFGLAVRVACLAAAFLLCSLPVQGQLSDWSREDIAGFNDIETIIVLGADEVLDVGAVDFNGLGFFRNQLQMSEAEIVAFRQAAEAWYLTRFGLDFSNATFDNTTGIKYNGFASLIPIGASGSYRVLASNAPLLWPRPGRMPRVIIGEYIIFFDASFSSPRFWGGSYAASSPTPLPILPSQSLAYAKYRIFAGPFRTFDIAMRSLIVNNPTNRGTFPQDLTENVQLCSPQFGRGNGVIEANFALAPDPVSGKYPTRARTLFTFPGSFAVPEYNVGTFNC